MEPKYIKEILEWVQQGKLNIEDAIEKIRNFPYEDLKDAKVDHHRPLRKGFPETIFCPGKTADQIIRICKSMIAHKTNVLATRCEKEVFNIVKKQIHKAKYHESARIFTVIQKPIQYREGYIAIVSAGTGDIPIAEESAITCETYGSRVERIYDVGVAGIHRLIDQIPKIRSAVAVIVCAGMEGALPSVVAGLIDKPV
ncbi:MAG: nickel pincer cofactor biosynthesis protein LarB, partial [Candidatus Hydrogenedens sp.]